MPEHSLLQHLQQPALSRSLRLRQPEDPTRETLARISHRFGQQHNVTRIPLTMLLSLSLIDGMRQAFQGPGIQCLQSGRVELRTACIATSHFRSSSVTTSTVRSNGIVKMSAASHALPSSSARTSIIQQGMISVICLAWYHYRRVDSSIATLS